MYFHVNDQESTACVAVSVEASKAPRCQATEEESFRYQVSPSASSDSKTSSEDGQNYLIRRMLRKRTATSQEQRAAVNTGWKDTSEKKTRRSAEVMTSAFSSFRDFHSAKLFPVTMEQSRVKAKVTDDLPGSFCVSISASFSDEVQYEKGTELEIESFRNAVPGYYGFGDSNGEPVDLTMRSQLKANMGTRDRRASQGTLSPQDDPNNPVTYSQSTNTTEQKKNNNAFDEARSASPTLLTPPWIDQLPSKGPCSSVETNRQRTETNRFSNRQDDLLNFHPLQKKPGSTELSEISEISQVSTSGATPTDAKKRHQPTEDGDIVMTVGTSCVKSDATSESSPNQSPYQKILELSRKMFDANGPSTVPLLKTDSLTEIQRSKKLEDQSSTLPVQTSDLGKHLIPSHRQFKTKANLADILQVRRIQDGAAGYPAARVGVGRWGRSLYSDAQEQALLRRYWWPWVTDEFNPMVAACLQPYSSAFQGAPSAQFAAAGNLRLHHPYAPTPAQENNRHALFENHGLNAQRMTSFPAMLPMNDIRGLINRQSFSSSDFLFDHPSQQNLTVLRFKSLTPNITDGLRTQTGSNHCNESTFRNSINFVQRHGSEVDAGQHLSGLPYVRNPWENWHQRFTGTGKHFSLLQHSSEAHVISAALNAPVNNCGCNCLDQAYRMRSYQAKHKATQEALTLDDKLGCYERKLPFTKLSSENGAFFKQLPY